MQYVCRSCILRLGQPWRTPAQPRRWLQPWPPLAWRMKYSSTIEGETSSVGKDDEGHDNHLGRDHHEAERFWTTGSVWSAASFPELSNAPGVDRLRTLAAPPSLKFRNGSTDSSESKLEPESLTPGRSQSVEEDWHAVAVDEALDTAHEVAHHGSSEQDEPSQAQQGNVKSNRRRPPVMLSRRDRSQLEIVRSRSQHEKKNYYQASADFISWKRLLKEISNPESKNPSLIERRMHHDILTIDSADSMRSLLRVWSPYHKQKKRNRILLYTTFRHAPEKGAVVLEALLHSRLPFYMLEDSLGFLAHHLRQMEAAVKQSCAQKLADMVVQTSRIGKKGHIRLQQHTIYSIMDALPPTQLEDWFHQLIAQEVPLHKYTLLQFASRFAKMSATKDLSLNIWQNLCETRCLDINTPLGASLCTSLLTFKEDDLHALDENSATPAELFQKLLDLGFVPNVITYTCIIQSLCAKQELQTAMEVFEVMKQHGVQPDGHTYSVMINGCKSCRDFETMLRFAFDARAADIRDPVIWNDIIHATFLACLSEPRVPGGVPRPRCAVWGPMNALYSRFFSHESLRILITGQFAEVREFMEKQGFIPSKMKGAFHDIPHLPANEVMQPSSSTLALMVLGFMRHLPRPYDLVQFYDHFKKLLKEGNPVAQILVEEQGSRVHDIVLRSLLKFDGTLRIMLDIIRDMMTDINPPAAETTPLSPHTFEPRISESSPNSATDTGGLAASSVAEADWEADWDTGWGAVDREQSTPPATRSDVDSHSGEARPPIRHPRPSVYTWSILIKAFMSNNQPHEAEHILKLMQVHGVKPNIVTWNTLAAEYARLGNTKQAVEAMRRLEAAGFKSDNWTMRAFSYIGDKDKAISLMEQTVEENKLTLAAIEEMDQQQQQGNWADSDETTKPEGRMKEYDLYPRQQENEPQTREELWQRTHRGATPSPGRDAQPEDQDSSRPAEEPRPVSGEATELRHEEGQKPVAKAPFPSKPDLGAWDDFLWDHAAEPEPAEKDKREELAA